MISSEFSTKIIVTILKVFVLNFQSFAKEKNKFIAREIIDKLLFLISDF